MSRTPRRAALLLAAAVLTTPAFEPASAADQQKCVYVPAVYMSGRPQTPTIPLCVPWPG